MSKTENCEERRKWSELGVRVDCSAVSLPPIDRRSWCFGVIEVKIVNACFCSLRGKRFFEVEKQRKTEERDFRCFARAKSGASVKNWKGGRAEEGMEGNACRQTLPALPISLCFVFFGSPTPRKRLLLAGYCYCGLLFLCSKIP